MATETENLKKTYSYVIKDGAGKVREGKAKATSAEALMSSFEKRGYALLEEPEEISTGGMNTDIGALFGKKKRVKPKDVALFARKFSSMQDAGIPIKKILSTLGNAKGQNPTLRETLKDLEASLSVGLSLSQAMAKHPFVFTELMVAMTSAGEQGGFLDKSMRQVAENLESEVKLRSKIKSAMTYPVVVLVMAGLMCMGMLLFIVPVFEEMFSSLGSELPLPTQVLVSLSDFLKVGLAPLVILAIAFSIWWRKNKMKVWIRKIKDPLMLRLPIIGLMTNKIIMARFSRNLGTLMENGVPILQCMKIVGATTGSIVIEEALEDVGARLRKGDALATSMRNHPIFPTEDIEMIDVGEEAGDIPPMLLKIADIYDQDVESTTEALTSLIEPLMIVFLGVVVGGMIIALYMPIFSIYDAVKGA